MLQMFECI